MHRSSLRTMCPACGSLFGLRELKANERGVVVESIRWPRPTCFADRSKMDRPADCVGTPTSPPISFGCAPRSWTSSGHALKAKFSAVVEGECMRAGVGASSHNRPQPTEAPFVRFDRNSDSPEGSPNDGLWHGTAQLTSAGNVSYLR